MSVCVLARLQGADASACSLLGVACDFASYRARVLRDFAMARYLREHEQVLWIANNTARHRRGLDTVGVATGAATRAVRSALASADRGTEGGSRPGSRVSSRGRGMVGFTPNGRQDAHTRRDSDASSAPGGDGDPVTVGASGRVAISGLRSSVKRPQGRPPMQPRRLSTTDSGGASGLAGMTSAQRIRLNSQMRPRQSILAVVLDNLGTAATPHHRAPSGASSYVSDADVGQLVAANQGVSSRRESQLSRTSHSTAGSVRSKDGLLGNASRGGDGFVHRDVPRLSRAERRRARESGRGTGTVEGGTVGNVMAPPAPSLRNINSLLGSSQPPTSASAGGASAGAGAGAGGATHSHISATSRALIRRASSRRQTSVRRVRKSSMLNDIFRAVEAASVSSDAKGSVWSAQP